MADAPFPITAPPNVPGQPYDASVSGTEDDTALPDVYGANQVVNGVWPKVKDAGAADWETGAISGGWPSDGTSDGGAWKQT